MGANWRATITVVLTLLQIKALISVKTTVGGVEGQSFSFRCDYQDIHRDNAKYFCIVYDTNCADSLIRTDKHDQWVEKGRFSLFDNTTGGFFSVRMDRLRLEDSGLYWCGVDINPDHNSVIQLNVSRATVVMTGTLSPGIHLAKEFTVDKIHLPLYLTAVMCVAAILCVCMFTLCLLLAVKQRRTRPQHNRETTSDYETMMPGNPTEPQLSCSCSDPDCPGLPPLPPPPPDLCSHFTSKHSAVTPGLCDYEDVDISGRICRYQHLDLTQLEEHVYHCLNGNGDGPGGVKEEIY
ncbi:CMRF35-like molecule 5 [Notolabrus celidotus]|uniref:CMRF35-like molecule 5 n=1 Tax=Notolabrus celidotus TaxID=1203425 RepID=UPI00148FB119|nr:CMRF35-like molecule 5 [Notolabrus celidotus]